MKHSVLRAAAASATGVALISWSFIAHGQDEHGASSSPSAAPAPAPVVVAPPRDFYVIEEKTPNIGLITGGAVMFGVPYAASVVVAAASDRPSDHNLYIPLAGPWMDLAKRGSCVGTRCESETGNKVLLVADGIFQGVGALEIVAGFLFPSTRTVARTAGVHVTPTAGFSSAGVAVYGAF